MATTVITKGSIAVNAAVSATTSGGNVPITVTYTAPANSYAIVQLMATSTGSAALSLDIGVSPTIRVSAAVDQDGYISQALYVPPGVTITSVLSLAFAVSGTVSIVGVSFINT